MMMMLMEKIKIVKIKMMDHWTETIHKTVKVIIKMEMVVFTIKIMVKGDLVMEMMVMIMMMIVLVKVKAVIAM